LLFDYLPDVVGEFDDGITLTTDASAMNRVNRYRQQGRSLYMAE
jgi:hypothetical protein